MNQHKKGRKPRKNGRAGKPPMINKGVNIRPGSDDKYKDVRMKTVEERKEDQLAKWRKELGLED